MSDEASPTPALTPSQEQWLEHLKAWQEQTLSLRAYARAHGLSLSGLYSAKRLFKQRGIWRGREVGRARRSKPTLVPVRLTPTPPSSPSFRLHLPNGVVLEVAEQVEPSRCQALVAALLTLPR